METTIIVALISGSVAFLGSMLGFVASERARKDKATNEISETLKSHRDEYIAQIDEVKDSIKDMTATYQKTVAVIDMKIDALEKAQNKHNNLIERMYKVEQDTAVHTEQIKVANHRIEDLERKQ